MRPARAQGKIMKNKGDLAPPKPGGAWTRPDAYLGALARRRTARKAREPGPRTEPESPRFLLSTLPFILLFVALLVITVGVVIAAWPGNQPQPQPKVAERERGVAPKGWFQEAEKEFHR